MNTTVFTAKYSSTIDGDSFKAWVKLPCLHDHADFESHLITIRISGIDAYEVRPNKYNDRYERQSEEQTSKGMRAEKYLAYALDLGEIININLIHKQRGIGGKRKARWIADVYIDGVNVALLLAEKELVKRVHYNLPNDVNDLTRR
ncbi:MAG: hypothetical protein P8P29_04345 [Flavobacteriaceae bacterium]|nr:hypothetical protein [Flavobacteriaceae bacterium]